MFNTKLIKKYLNRSNKGGVLAEAALTIPLLIGVTFFIIEFGNVLYLTNSVNQIARTAARFASVTPTFTNQDIITASGAMNILPDIARLNLTVNPAGGAQRAVGATITVTAQYNYTPIINPFGLLGSNQIWAPVVRGTAIARSEVTNAP